MGFTPPRVLRDVRWRSLADAAAGAAHAHAKRTNDATPAEYATTITDVALDGTFPAKGHEDRVRRWAADTVAARG
ncbi:hypothetical protein HD597_010221 [Nonomuraea thailandensis]|uniref:Uncharacterized protein n=1 Tax=Nonomuraea thailandensis TaxID=1188745 RepID=A0A9X2GQ58_9ACTN|nr:DUF5946 family protein [Nonomuraea thailandensis]MCP2363201.1 hypothetical protein [Nonomuraea thailandensis]